MSPSDTHTHTQIHVSARALRDTHTHAPHAHTPGTTVLQQTRICGTIIVNHPGRRCGRSMRPPCIESPLLRPWTSKSVAAQKGQRNAETFDSVSHLPSVAILSQALCCSHFVSQPFSTLLSFSWGCQMARVNPLHPPSIICDRFGWQTNRWADTQADRETEGRQMTGFDELYGDVCGKTDRRMCVGKQTDR